MKTVLLFSILFCAIAVPAMGALTDADLDKIRLIVQEEIKREIAPLITDINQLKTNDAIRQTELKNLSKNIDDKFESVEKNFDRQNSIIIACIGIPLAVLAIGATIWGILASKRSTKDRTLEQQIEVLTQEIETLKQQRTVQP